MEMIGGTNPGVTCSGGAPRPLSLQEELSMEREKLVHAQRKARGLQTRLLELKAWIRTLDDFCSPVQLWKTRGSDGIAREEWEAVLPADVQYVFYTYEIGDYEGSGWALLVYFDGAVRLIGLDHCSCYSPLDGVDAMIPEWDTLDEAAAALSAEVARETKKLFRKARECL